MTTSTFQQMDQQERLSALLELLPDLQCAYLFGSQADGSAHSASDIDLAVVCNAPLEALQRWEVAEQLASRWLCDVDLVDGLQASTVLRMQIVTRGRCFYSQGEAAARFEMTTLSMYQHLQSERAAILAQWQQDWSQ